MEKQTYKFTAVQSLQLENSFGTIATATDVQLDVSLGINSEDYGWFEFYDIETGGDNWYAEGGLWFDGKELVDYDGVFSLPPFILDKLEELGYNVEDYR
jgi:hypothetical protein